MIGGGDGDDDDDDDNNNNDHHHHLSPLDRCTSIFMCFIRMVVIMIMMMMIGGGCGDGDDDDDDNNNNDHHHHHLSPLLTDAGVPALRDIPERDGTVASRLRGADLPARGHPSPDVHLDRWSVCQPFTVFFKQVLFILL